MPIDRKKGEREDEYISRCIATEISAGKPTEQAVAICYNKSRMSKEKSGQMLEEKVFSKIKQVSHINSIRLADGKLEDACWEGYVAIGTKIKDGREVPNCVPKEQGMEAQPSISSSYPGEIASGSK